MYKILLSVNLFLWESSIESYEAKMKMHPIVKQS